MIGRASLFRDSSRAIEEGREDSSVFLAEVLAANEWDAIAAPVLTPLSSKNRRRDIIKPPERNKPPL